LTHDDLTQRCQALVDGSITLNEFKAWFSYHHPVGSAGQIIPDAEPVIPGEALSLALAAAPTAPPELIREEDYHYRSGKLEAKAHRDKSNDIRNALQLSGFKAIQIQRADYGFAYEIIADYQGKRVQRTITRPDIHLVVDLMRDEAE
jgi:hypothetical protein